MNEENSIYIIVFVMILVGGMVFAGKGAIDYTQKFLNEKVNVSAVKNPFVIKMGEPTIEFVSSTEYQFGDNNGATIIKLIDNANRNINTTCYESILYPDKSIYIDWSLMTQQLEYGNYYFNFALPDVTGIYDQEVRCLVNNKNISIGKGFHIGNLTSTVESIVSTKVDELKVPSILMVT